MSQQFRFEELKLRGFPAVIIQPPLNKKYGDPGTVVFLRQGYDGDPDALCRAMSEAIRHYVQKLAEKRGATKAKLPPPAKAPEEIGGKGPIKQAPDVEAAPPRVGVDPPWSPPPKVEPAPAPRPDTVLPPLFEVPPRPQPQPRPDAQPDGAAGEPIPVAPQLSIVVDGNVLTESDQAHLDCVIRRIQRDRPGLIVRIREWRDSKHLPVRKDDLPALVVTSEGKVDDKISGRLLPFLRPAEPQTPRAVGLTDVPWSLIFSLLTGGGVSGVGFAVAGLKAWRAMRAARGKPQLANDAQFAQLLAGIGSLVARLAPKPADPAKT